MKKKRSAGRILLWAAVVILAVPAAAGLVYPRAVRAVWCNLTAEKLDLSETDEWNGGSTYLKLPYASESESQYVDLYVPDPEHSAAQDRSLPKLYVIIHGGGFVYNDSQSRQARLMLRYFRDHGYACASVNYRLAQEAPFPGAVEDCKATIRFLRAHAGEYGYDAQKIAVFGESAGGYLAAMCAVTDDTEFSDLSFIDEDQSSGQSPRI